MQRKYSSFEAIDKDLKILKLKKDIDWLCVKNDYQSLLRHLSVKHIFSDVVEQVKTSVFEKKTGIISVVAGFLLKRFFK